MKKSVCLMAILGAFCTVGVNAQVVGANDQSVEITFTGRVTESTCKIELIGTGRSLDLGTIKKAGQTWAATDRGTLVPIVFNITECDKDKVAGVTLAADTLGANNGTSNIAQGTLETTQKPINVQLYKDDAGAQQGLIDISKKKVDLVGNEGQKSGRVMAGFAALKHNGDGTKLEAGNVITARAMFNLTFE